MNKKTIGVIALIILTVLSGWNFARVFFGYNVWVEPPDIIQAYGTGFLLSIPMMCGLGRKNEKRI